MDYYSSRDVPNIEKVSGIRLSHPIVVKEEDHDDQWIPDEPKNRVERSTSSPIPGKLSWGKQSPRGEPRRKSGPERVQLPPNSPDGGFRDVRPPPPPPPPPPGSGLEYDEVRPINVDHTKELIYHLRSSERCECGLYVQDAMLPERWAVHLTGNPTGPKAFFVSPDNQSHWKLPSHVRAMLEPHQKAVLDRYGV